MAINTLATATLFQETLDKVAMHEALTGWMEANAGDVIYNGGAEIKIPKNNPRRVYMSNWEILFFFKAIIIRATVNTTTA